MKYRKISMIIENKKQKMKGKINTLKMKNKKIKNKK